MEGGADIKSFKSIKTKTMADKVLGTSISEGK